MKMTITTIIAIVLILFLTLCMTSCSNSEIREETQTSMNIETNSQDIEEDYIRTLAENLYVSYSIPEYTNINTYSTELATFNIDQLDSFFSGTPVISEDDYGNIVAVFENEGETARIIRNRSISWFTENGNKLDRFARSARREINDGFAQFDYLDNNAECMRFTNNPKELSFAGKSTIIEELDEALNEIGFDICSYYFIPVTEDLFEQYSSWYDKNLASGAKESETGYFGDCQEFYYIKAVPQIDGIEILNDKDFLLDDLASEKEDNDINSILGSQIFFVYTANGIESFEIITAYNVYGVLSENIDIISVEEAEKLLTEKYSNMLVYDPVTFTSLELIYVPMSGCELIPYWRFSDGGDNEFYFNAIDGSELN